MFYTPKLLITSAKHTTICFSAGLHKYYLLELYQNFPRILVKLRSHLIWRVKGIPTWIQKNPDFPLYLLLHALFGVCPLRVFLFLSGDNVIYTKKVLHLIRTQLINVQPINITLFVSAITIMEV